MLGGLVDDPRTLGKRMLGVVVVLRAEAALEVAGARHHVAAEDRDAPARVEPEDLVVARVPARVAVLDLVGQEPVALDRDKLPGRFERVDHSVRACSETPEYGASISPRCTT